MCEQMIHRPTIYACIVRLNTWFVSHFSSFFTFTSLCRTILSKPAVVWIASVIPIRVH